MPNDLSKMTRKQLEKLQRDVAKALEKLRNQDMKAAKRAAEKAAAAHGFSLAEITGGATTATKPTAKAKPKKGAPKYRNPEDKSQTWTGKGRQPEWFKSAVASGKTPEALAI